ncbi:hypothetical protein Acr_00g0018900 [Actinidia rufa]|uniref:DUF4283 domain-containing protein n=1 Tax=Actinidia rufa TaxID=165716 RepID=A0A7J0DBJ7_9ERIC|nr:hypothetical protein Acr_00g0018900 [Actinidia rufa]
MRRILCLGKKTVEISTVGESEGEVELVERGAGVHRRLTLSRFEAGWLGGVLTRIQQQQRWGLNARLRGGSRQVEVIRRQNTGGEFVEVVVSLYTVRGDGANVRSKSGGRPSFGTMRLANSKPREKVTYLQAASSGIWPPMSCEVREDTGRKQDIVEELFRALGDRCGGYITTAEETLSRDHAEWARICVRGTGSSILATLSIGMGSLVYVCPVWAESGARVVRRSEPTKDMFGEKRERGAWLETMQQKRLSGRQTNKGGLGIRRDFIPVGGRGREWPMGWAPHNIKRGGPSKGIKGMVRQVSQWAQPKGTFVENQALARVQEVMPINKQVAELAEGIEEDTEPKRSIGGKGKDGIKALKHGLNGTESGVAREAAETPFVDDNREGEELAIVPSEQIEPIVSVGPGVEEIRSEDDGDWLSERGVEVVRLAWATRKLKGFGKFLEISYSGMEEEATRLFARIEEQWSTQARTTRGWGREVTRNRGKRELKNLEWQVAEGRRKGRGRSWPRGHEKSSLGEHSISCLFKNVDDGYKWAFAGIYGPQSRRDRLRVWEELARIRAAWGTPWVCGGDFNVVRCPYERGVVGKIRRFWESIISLARKLRLLKIDLKRWNREVFGRGEVRLATLVEEVQALEARETLPGLFVIERDRRVELKADIGGLLIAEEIRVDGVLAILHEERDFLASGIVGFYKKLYTESEQWRPTMDGFSLPSLNSEEADALPLRERFPELFALSTNQDVLVADCWTLTPSGGIWDPRFRRRAHDWELEAFAEFFRLLQEVQPMGQEDDKWRWKRQGKRSFTVSSFYHSLTGHLTDLLQDVFTDCECSRYSKDNTIRCMR